MSKTKKALKKSSVSGSAKPALAAKKAPAMKSKTVATKPSAVAKPSSSAAKKAAKAAHAKGKPAGKAPVKSAPTKTAPPAKTVSAAKTPSKPAASAPVKKGAGAAQAAKAPAKSSATAASVSSPQKAPAAKTSAPVAKQEAPVDMPKPAAAAKGKKGRAEEVPAEPEEEIILLDAEGRRYCRVRECDQASAVDGYCRYHYLLYWKNIQVRKTILSEGKLERYIEDLTARYPDKYLEMLKKDLRTEKDFLAAIQELEIDESSVDNEYEDEAQNYLDEVRGMSSEAGSSSDRDEEF